MKLPTALTSLVTATFVGTALLAGCASPSEGGEDVVEGADMALSSDDESRLEVIRKMVSNLDEEKVAFGADVKAPEQSAGSGHRAAKGSLGGVDWFQKWPGGVSADHGWNNGTEIGKRCMWAAVARFEAIMQNPPAEYLELRANYSGWGGSFYNWVDDYSKPEAGGDASTARLWAWRTGLTKFISAAAKDGSCYLPTRQLLIDYSKKCAERVASGAEMQGCDAR